MKTCVVVFLAMFFLCQVRGFGAPVVSDEALRQIFQNCQKGDFGEADILFCAEPARIQAASIDGTQITKLLYAYRLSQAKTQLDAARKDDKIEEILTTVNQFCSRTQTKNWPYPNYPITVVKIQDMGLTALELLVVCANREIINQGMRKAKLDDLGLRQSRLNLCMKEALEDSLTAKDCFKMVARYDPCSYMTAVFMKNRQVVCEDEIELLSWWQYYYSQTAKP